MAAPVLSPHDLAAGFDAVANVGRVHQRTRQLQAREARRTAADQRKKDAKQTRKDDFGALAQAWNSVHGLRVGGTVAEDGSKARGRLSTWTLEGLLRLGFQGCGRHAAHTTGAVDSTSHTLDALVSVSLLCSQAETTAFHGMLDTSISQGRLR